MIRGIQVDESAKELGRARGWSYVFSKEQIRRQPLILMEEGIRPSKDNIDYFLDMYNDYLHLGEVLEDTAYLDKANQVMEYLKNT